MALNGLATRLSPFHHRTVAAALLATVAFCHPALAYRQILLKGINSTDNSGRAVAGAGDFNGDGFDDVIIGAPGATPGEYAGAGEAYVVFGWGTPGAGQDVSVELSSLDGSNGFKITGLAADDQFGRAVAAAGDVNGDGFDDVIVGAPHGSLPSRTWAGKSYVIFGRATAPGASMSVSQLDGSNGFRIDGKDAFDGSGFAVAGGDINGDGYDDLIVGARYGDPGGDTNPGETYVVYGRAISAGASFDLGSINGTNGFMIAGVTMGERTGEAVACAGDVNGDGYEDVLTGARFSSPNGVRHAGASYVVFGRPNGLQQALVNLSALNGTNGFRIRSNAEDEASGFAVSAAGDFNGDGFDDLVVGAPGGDVPRTPLSGNFYDAGKTYLVYGRASGFSADLWLQGVLVDRAWWLGEDNEGDFSGYSASAAGDFDGDGFEDFAIGVPRLDTTDNGADSGMAFVALGFRNTPAFDHLLLKDELCWQDNMHTCELSWNGTGPNGHGGSTAYEGFSVGNAGDFNGDGLTDVIAGAPLNRGMSIISLAAVPGIELSRTGSAIGQYMSGGTLDDRLAGQGGPDVLEGRQGRDALIGGPGGDAASYEHADARVTANLGKPSLNRGVAGGDSYTGIENLIGSRFNDSLTGNAAANTIWGLAGKDRLAGGGGPDSFAYRSLRDTGVGQNYRDVITDFNAGTSNSSVDKIDLSAIDANTTQIGNQAFTFIGRAAFSHTPGQLRAFKPALDTTVIAGDVNGDAVTDFQIELQFFATLSRLDPGDFDR